MTDSRWNKFRGFIHDLKLFGVGQNRFYGNRLPAELRYIGPRFTWYSGPIYGFGLWWGHFYYAP